MFRKSRMLEQASYLEDMIVDLRWEVKNLQERVKLLEERAIKEDIKKFNKKNSEQKRKPGRPRKNKEENNVVKFGRTTERSAASEIAKYKAKGYSLESKKKVEGGFEIVMKK